MIIWLILAVLFNVYFVVMRICSPETIFGSFFSFSSIWFWLSVVCFVIFCLRKHHLWKKSPRALKITVFSVFSADFSVSFSEEDFCAERAAFRPLLTYG